MNRLLFFFLCIIFFVTAKGQSSYAEAMQQGDDAFKKAQYKTAINKYFAAEAFDPAKKDVVKEKVNKVFDVIETLRKKAEDAEKLAKDANLKALASLKKANKLIDAFYFYKDRFALTSKENRFYFIDKNGDIVTKLGEWYKAVQFDDNGFARVSDYQKDYLIDTFGTSYIVAYDVKDIDSNVRAVDLSYKQLESLAGEVFTNKALQILILANNELTSLPKEIGELKDLKILDISLNQLDGLPIEIGNLKNLKSLNIRGSGLPEAEFKKIKQLLPDCKINPR